MQSKNHEWTMDTKSQEPQQLRLPCLSFVSLRVHSWFNRIAPVERGERFQDVLSREKGRLAKELERARRPQPRCPPAPPAFARQDERRTPQRVPGNLKATAAAFAFAARNFASAGTTAADWTKRSRVTRSPVKTTSSAS
jgi:hypothetical protein